MKTNRSLFPTELSPLTVPTAPGFFLLSRKTIRRQCQEPLVEMMVRRLRRQPRVQTFRGRWAEVQDIARAPLLKADAERRQAEGRGERR